MGAVVPPISALPVGWFDARGPRGRRRPAPRARWRVGCSRQTRTARSCRVSAVPGRPRRPVSASISPSLWIVVRSMARALSSARSARFGCSLPQRSNTVRSTETVGMPLTTRTWWGGRNVESWRRMAGVRTLSALPWVTSIGPGWNPGRRHSAAADRREAAGPDPAASTAARSRCSHVWTEPRIRVHAPGGDAPAAASATGLRSVGWTCHGRALARDR